MAHLLVSVRSAAEARAALAGGAAILDVKEPARGALGRADSDIWRAVRAVAPPEIAVSVALGELLDPTLQVDVARFDWSTGGIAFVKLGLAGTRPLKDWKARWASSRGWIGAGPSWVAVAYLDWQTADAASPDAVIDAAIDARAACAGLLVDTYDKSATTRLDSGWTERLRRARAAGLFLALAGRLDAAEMRRLSWLQPDIFAVRGAACRAGDRTAPIDRERVCELARAAAQAGDAGESTLDGVVERSIIAPSWSRIGSGS